MIFTDTRTINRTLTGLRDRVPLILQQGGSSSGKTWGNLYALLSYLLYDRKEEKLLASVVAETFPHLKKGAIKDFKDIIEETGLVNVIQQNKTDHQFVLPTGSIIEFFSADNGTKVRGPRRDILFMNEANSIPWEIYYQLNLRTRESTILDWNPSGEYWLHENLLPTMQESEYLFTRTTYKDNPALNEKTIKEIERLRLIDPMLYKIYGEGKTGTIQGLVFVNLAYCDKLPEQLRKEAYGLDFGFTNDPTALVRIGEAHGELWGEELLYESGLTNDDICDRLLKLGISKTAEIWADSAEPKSIEEIRRKGWNIKATTKGADSVNFGIDLLKKYRLNITNASTNWRKEAKNYKWKVDSKTGKSLNEPVDAFNHAWDAARYYAVKSLGEQPTSRLTIARAY